MPVSAKPAKKTGKTIETTVDCLVQRSAQRVDGYSVSKVAKLDEMKKGDKLILKANKICEEYNVAGARAVSSATLTLTGVAIDPSAKEGKEVRYFIVGATT